MKQRNFILKQRGDALLFVLIFITVIGILFDVTATWIINGQKATFRTNFQTEALNVSDLAMNLLASPTVCTPAMNGVALVGPTTWGPARYPIDPNPTVSGPGAAVNPFPRLDGVPGNLLSTGSTYNRVTVTRMRVFDLGSIFGANPIHQLAFEITLTSATGYQTYNGVSYFYAVTNGVTITACMPSTVGGNIYGAYIRPTNSGSGTGYGLVVVNGNTFNRNPAPYGGQALSIVSVGTLTGTGSVCIPDMWGIGSSPNSYTATFLAPTSAPVAFTQTLDPLTGERTNCANVTTGPLNWVFSGYQTETPD